MLNLKVGGFYEIEHGSCKLDSNARYKVFIDNSNTHGAYNVSYTCISPNSDTDSIMDTLGYFWDSSTSGRRIVDYRELDKKEIIDMKLNMNMFTKKTSI